jgi:hypothetical protein
MTVEVLVDTEHHDASRRSSGYQRHSDSSVAAPTEVALIAGNLASLSVTGTGP